MQTCPACWQPSAKDLRFRLDIDVWLESPEAAAEAAARIEGAAGLDLGSQPWSQESVEDGATTTASSDDGRRRVRLIVEGVDGVLDGIFGATPCEFRDSLANVFASTAFADASLGSPRNLTRLILRRHFVGARLVLEDLVVLPEPPVIRGARQGARQAASIIVAAQAARLSPAGAPGVLTVLDALIAAISRIEDETVDMPAEMEASAYRSPLMVKVRPRTTVQVAGVVGGATSPERKRTTWRDQHFGRIVRPPPSVRSNEAAIAKADAAGVPCHLGGTIATAASAAGLFSPDFATAASIHTMVLLSDPADDAATQAMPAMQSPVRAHPNAGTRALKRCSSPTASKGWSPPRKVARDVMSTTSGGDGGGGLVDESDRPAGHLRDISNRLKACEPAAPSVNPIQRALQRSRKAKVVKAAAIAEVSQRLCGSTIDDNDAGHGRATPDAAAPGSQGRSSVAASLLDVYSQRR